jgi:hypothetical protein
MRAPIECTLLDLVQTVNKLTDDDQEVVAMVVALVNSGRVRLCGNFAGATIHWPVSLSTCPPQVGPTLLGVQASLRRMRPEGGGNAP